MTTDSKREIPALEFVDKTRCEPPSGLESGSAVLSTSGLWSPMSRTTQTASISPRVCSVDFPNRDARELERKSMREKTTEDCATRAKLKKKS